MRPRRVRRARRARVVDRDAQGRLRRPMRLPLLEVPLPLRARRRRRRRRARNDCATPGPRSRARAVPVTVFERVRGRHRAEAEAGRAALALSVPVAVGGRGWPLAARQQLVVVPGAGEPERRAVPGARTTAVAFVSPADRGQRQTGGCAAASRTNQHSEHDSVEQKEKAYRE